MCERNGFFADPFAEHAAGFLFICCKSSTVDTLQSDLHFQKLIKWCSGIFFYKELFKIKKAILTRQLLSVA